MADKPFEIPTPVREIAEQQVTQARAAYGQFVDIAKQAQEMMQRSTEAVATNARDVQSKALKYAQSNMEASFNLASDLAKARDLKEWMEIQARYTQAQMQAYTTQAQELSRMAGEAVEKAKKR